MTTAHALAPRRNAPSRLPRWVQAGVWQLSGYAAITGGFLLLIALGAVVVLAIISRSTTPTESALQYPLQGLAWIPFAMAIHFTTNWLRPHIAAGMTRRSFAAAAVATVLALGPLTAVAVVAAFRVEAWAYAALGWTAGAASGFVIPGQIALGPLTWGIALLVSTFGMTGLLVGLTYARFGPIATLLLPVSLLPLPASLGLAIDPTTMFVPFTLATDDGTFFFGSWVSLSANSLGASVGIGSTILALTALAIHLLIRRMPIRARRS